MPSGKRAKQQRREAATAVKTPPPVRSKGLGGARARQASPRSLGIAGAVVLVAVIAIVLGVILGSGGGSGGGSNTVTAADIKGLPASGSQTWPGALQGAGESNDLFKGIPQSGLVLGNPNAHVEMLMFIDVQCPVCQNYEVSYLPTVVQKYIQTGKVQLHLQPWAFLGGAGSQSFSGRLGLIAATFQNKGYEYAKVLYDNQGQEESGWLDGKEMATIAASVSGLNLSKWQKDANSSGAAQIAHAADKLATTYHVTGTPTIFVGKLGGQLHDIVAQGVAPSLQDTQQALDAQLASS
jgi:protein-disulfide isomerase